MLVRQNSLDSGSTFSVPLTRYTESLLWNVSVLLVLLEEIVPQTRNIGTIFEVIA